MLLALLAGLLAAQSPAAAAASGGDPYGRDSPRGLTNGLLDALAEQDYGRATQYFDLSTVAASKRGETGLTIAHRLQQVLDAGGSLIQPVRLSDQPAGRVDDDLPTNQERIGTLPGPPGGAPVPLIATSTTVSGKAVWLISRDSLLAILAKSSVDSGKSLRDRMPAQLREIVWFGAPLADWLLLIGVALACYVGVRLLSLIVLLAFSRLHPLRHQSLWCRAIIGAPTAISLWIGMALFLAITRTLEASIVAKQLIERVAGAIALLAFAWFVWRMLDLAADVIAGRMQQSKRLRARSVIIFLRRALKLLILVFALIQALKVLGVDVTTGIAALGIGGVAIALGAQKTVENLVGSVSVVADEPVRVGDFCKVGDVMGTVEEIGMRSTRIRTNERTIVTIPNGNFAALQIENYSARDRFLFAPTFRLAIDLDAATVERVLAELRAALAENGALTETRANFNRLGDNWIEIEIFAWMNVPDWSRAVEMRETLWLEIMRRVEAAGGRFFGSTRPIPAPPQEKPAEQEPPRQLRAQPR